MAGEINSTNIVIENGTGEIVGQMEATITYGGELIDISNKSNGDFVTYISGERSAKQIVWSGSIVWNTDAQAQKVLNDALTGTADTYTVTYPNSGTTNASFTGSMIPNGRADTAPHGGALNCAITLSTSGTYTAVPYAA